MKIKTVKDIINATNEDNLDRFIEDLRVYLQLVHSLAPLGGKSDSFNWKDDGKNDVKVILTEK